MESQPWELPLSSGWTLPSQAFGPPSKPSQMYIWLVSFKTNSWMPEILCMLIEHVPWVRHIVNVPARSLQSCLTLCSPMDCSPPGSSVHAILQVRILEWVAMPSSIYYLYHKYVRHNINITYWFLNIISSIAKVFIELLMKLYGPALLHSFSTICPRK